MLKVTCLILNYNDAETTIKLIGKIKKYKSINYILVIDNCSTDNSYKILKNKFLNERNIIIKSTRKNGGYGYGNNFGIKYAFNRLKSKYIVVANPDVFFTDLTIRKMLNVMLEKRAALVAPVQRIKNVPIYDKAWKIPTPFQWTMSEGIFYRYFLKKFHYKKSYFKLPLVRVDCVPGAMFMVDAEKFLSVDGYDEEMFLFGEETVLGFKLKRAGYSTYLLTNEYYDHQHSVSIDKSIKSKIKQQRILHRSKLIFFKKYQRSGVISIICYSFMFSVKILKMKIKNSFEGIK